MELIRFLSLLVFGLVPSLLFVALGMITVLSDAPWTLWDLAIVGGAVGSAGIFGFMSGADRKVPSLRAHLTAIAMIIGLISAVGLFITMAYILAPLLMLLTGPVAIAAIYLYRYSIALVQSPRDSEITMSKPAMLLLDMLKGSLATVLLSLPIAFLFATLFRLPMPFGPAIGPFGDSSAVQLGILDTWQAVFSAWFSYGILGSGFVVLFIFGGLASLVISHRCAQKNSKSNKNKMIILWSIAISVIGILFLSVLDYIVG